MNQRGAYSKSSVPTRNVTTYSRSFLLSLYQSPLVPTRPEGMKDLSEWFGDYDPPSFSPTRQHQQPPITSLTSSSSIISVGETRNERTARPNPFANFGRFGVDGGLEGTVPTAVMSISTKGGEGKRNRDSAPHLHGGAIEKEKSHGRERDWESSRRGGAGTSPDKYGSPPTTYLSERERPERISRRGGDVTASSRGDQRESAAGGRERREEKKEGRAEEGGWRTAGDRERRLRPNQSNSNSNSFSDPLRASTSDSRNTRTSKSNQPAWMDDDTPAATGSSSTPAWMDAPASGDASYTPGESSRAGAPVDDIQAWKQQMKEMERKEKEHNHPSAPPGFESVVPESVNRVDPPLEHTVPELIHQSLSNHNTTTVKAESRPQTAQSIAASHAPGGESRTKSRFAKYFDGAKPAPMISPPLVSPPVSAATGFGALLSGGNGASTEDRESMNRLMGMLQLSGSRKSTDSIPQVAKAAVATRQPSPPAVETRSRQASSGSRFGFAQPSQATSQVVVTAAQSTARPEAVPSSQSQQFYQQQQQYAHPPSAAHSQLPPLSSQLTTEAASRNGYGERSRSSSNAPLASPTLSQPPQQQQQQQQYAYGPDGRPYALPPSGMSRLPNGMEYSHQQYAQQVPPPRSQSQQRQAMPNYPPPQANYGPPPPGMNRMPDPMMQQQQQQQAARASLPNGFTYSQQQQQFPPQFQQQRLPPTGAYYQSGGPDLMALLNSRPLPPR